MLKKISLLGFLLVFAFLVSGCGTVAKGACGLGRGIKEGAKEDWAWLTNSTTKADGWVKENLW
jgi:predicted small secreted protein